MNDIHSPADEVTEAELYKFCDELTKNINAHFKTAGDGVNTVQVVFQRGPKFTRVVQNTYVHSTWTGNSAFGFIDNSNGDILRADGWERPARGVRGNIRQPWWGTAVTP